MKYSPVALYGPAVAFTAFCWISCLSCSPGKRAEVALENNEIKAQHVETVTAQGLSDLITAGKGRVVVMNFWATWCPPCVAEMPELAEFYRTHLSSNVGFYAISLDAADQTDSVVRPFLKEKDIPFPVWILAERDIEAVSAAVRAEISGALPITLVYDQRGELAKLWEGSITLKELEELIAPLL